MDKLRAAGALYLELDLPDRVAVAVFVVLALAATLAVATAPPAPGAVAIADGATTMAEPMTGLAMTRELAADPAALERLGRDDIRNTDDPARRRLTASGLTLTIALPVGIWLGLMIAGRRRPAPERGTAAAGVTDREPAARATLADQVEQLKRSLRRRDRRIATLKKRLKTRAGASASPAEPVAGVSRLENELAEAQTAIQRLEDLLQDQQDDWARSELISARGDARITALEADLRAAGDIIESLHEDIGYWKRRAVQAPADRDIFKRLTG